MSTSAVLARSWFETWRLTTSLAWEAVTLMANGYHPRIARTRWSTTATQAFDKYLRSPECLELMALNLRAVAGVRRLIVR